jgi:hypothetical protein
VIPQHHEDDRLPPQHGRAPPSRDQSVPQAQIDPVPQPGPETQRDESNPVDPWIIDWNELSDVPIFDAEERIWEDRSQEGW